MSSVLDERLEMAGERIREMTKEAEVQQPFLAYFRQEADYLAVMLEEMAWVEAGGPEQAELEELQIHNSVCYIDLVGKSYDSSYVNPAYAVKMLGEPLGQILSMVAAELRSLPTFIYERDREAVVIRLELFLELYHLFAYAAAEEKSLPSEAEVKAVVYWFASDYAETFTERKLRDMVEWKDNFAANIIDRADLSDLRYLYLFGEYITTNQWETAEYLNSLPEEQIRKLADTFTEGYRRGFEVAGKPLHKKKTVNIRYPLGFERIIKAAIENFRRMGLEPVIYRAAASFVEGRGVYKNGFFGGPVNRQFDYDHEQDYALYYDKKYGNRKLECYRSACEKYREEAAVHAGPAVLESFGEADFSPENKPERLQLSEQEQQLYVQLQSAMGAMITEYINPAERSFTIMALPVPEIGADFPAIFDQITAINTLDSKLYEGLQQKLIDALDQAAWVEIKGCGENRTDLTVMLHELADPARETNFENCVADVNIPVGEVFTSPRLTGTNGVLHVSRVFLNGLQYKDLSLTFRDGMIAEYTCGNFDSEEENRKLLKEKLLFHHDTLPLGEFAIGTNTTAYVAAGRFDIADKLPILIAEKMGPHFAVGDTCYMREEDLVTHNPDGKAIVARENEVSALRKEDPGKAYFNCHTDITIPYEELGELTAVTAAGEGIPIIENGKFVLEGTEELNLPLYGAG